MNAPRTPLSSLDDALADLLGAVQPLSASENVAIFDADGRVLAADVVSLINVPALDNSSMDGYAVRCDDVAAGNTVLHVAQRIAAGAFGEPLAAGTAARIFTGAQLPQQADAIVMQEDCEALADGMVRIKAQPQPGRAAPGNAARAGRTRSGGQCRDGQSAGPQTPARGPVFHRR